MHVDGKVFRIGSGFWFAAQVPDNTVGCSGSRCSNCGMEVAYVTQLCPQCLLPLIGPSGLPQYPGWQALSLEDKMVVVEDVFVMDGHGRHGFANVDNLPITRGEMSAFYRRSEYRRSEILRAHEVNEPQKSLGIMDPPRFW